MWVVPIGRVVHLEDQVRAGRDQLGGAGGEDRGHVARRRAAEVPLAHAPLRAAVVVDHDDDMVDHGGIAGPGLGRLNPHVLLEMGRHPQVDCRGPSPGRGRSAPRGARRRRRACRSPTPRGTSAAAAGPWRRPAAFPARPRPATSPRSRTLRCRSLRKCPYRGSACQGGIRRSSTTSAIIAEWRRRRRRSAARTVHLTRPVAGLTTVLNDRRHVGGIRHLADVDRLLRLDLLQGGHDLRRGGSNPGALLCPGADSAIDRILGRGGVSHNRAEPEQKETSSGNPPCETSGHVFPLSCTRVRHHTPPQSPSDWSVAPRRLT